MAAYGKEGSKRVFGLGSIKLTVELSGHLNVAGLHVLLVCEPVISINVVPTVVN